jgi:hypothetical protein
VTLKRALQRLDLVSRKICVWYWLDVAFTSARAAFAEEFPSILVARRKLVAKAPGSGHVETMVDRLALRAYHGAIPTGQEHDSKRAEVCRLIERREDAVGDECAATPAQALAQLTLAIADGRRLLDAEPGDRKTLLRIVRCIYSATTVLERQSCVSIRAFAGDAGLWPDPLLEIERALGAVRL